jgi:ATP-dependent helicase YprA (DUF1998 family)
MPDPLTCPFCSATSHNPNDADRRYCSRCHVFVDDAIARRDALGACRGHPTTPIHTAEHLEQCVACGAEIPHDLVEDQQFGFVARCIWRARADG